MWWSSRWAELIPSRRSVLQSKRFYTGRPSSRSKARAPKCTPSMKRAGLVFRCSGNLAALGIGCYVVCPQKLDEQNKRVKTDGLDAKALCLRLDRFVQGNRDALAMVRVPTEEEERSRAIHRQREQLVGARKRLEAQGRSLMVNHGLEPVQNWWKPRTFAALPVPQWMRELLLNSQPILLALQEKIAALTRATAKRCRSQSTARTGKNDQRRDRSGDWRLAPV